MPIGKYFAGATGLDVGARVPCLISSRSKLRLAVPPDREPDDFKESFVPHYRYYADIGCTMEAIDLVAGTEDKLIKHGDARMLPYPSESFDFITVPMLLGPNNVCATPIEIILCMLEFRRVLRPGGFLYLADPIIEPSVVYTGQQAGFKCYYSKGQCYGLPVGTVFRRTGSYNSTDRFEDIFEHFNDTSLKLSDYGEETIWSADLLWDREIPSTQHSL